MTSFVNNMLGPTALIKASGDKVCTERNGIVLEWQREPDVKQATFLGFLILVRLDEQGNIFLGTLGNRGTKLKPQNITSIHFQEQFSVFLAISVDTIHCYEWIPSISKLKLRFHQRKPDFAPTFLQITPKLLHFRWDYSGTALTDPSLPIMIAIAYPSFTVTETTHIPAPAAPITETPNPKATVEHPKLPIPAENHPQNSSPLHTAPQALLLDRQTLDSLDLAQKTLSPSLIAQLPLLLKQHRIPEDVFLTAQTRKAQNREQIDVLLSNLSGLAEYRSLRLMFAQHYLLARNLERLGREIQANQVARRGVPVEPVCKLCKTEAGKKTLWQLADTLETFGSREFWGHSDDRQHWLINRSTANQNRQISGHLSCYLRSAHKNQEAWEQIKKAQTISKRLAEVSEILAKAATTSSFGQSLTCSKQPLSNDDIRY